MALEGSKDEGIRKSQIRGGGGEETSKILNVLPYFINFDKPIFLGIKKHITSDAAQIKKTF